MNYRLLYRNIGLVSLLIAGFMCLSLPWAIPSLGDRGAIDVEHQFETRGFFALLTTIVISVALGLWLIRLGRGSSGQLFRKEAMATVGLSWVLASVLGGLPFLLAGVQRAPDTPMNFSDSLFEAQSGFSTTGATVITNLEDPIAVPHCILFWRSSTHFLGGLGIVVLFVAILGYGSAGKALMRAEITGPNKDGSQPRMQQTALRFAGIYCGLNAVLAVIYMLQGMTLFDAICHAFGTLATGGFSTYNASLGHFQSPAVEYATILFMLLAGVNFMLIYVCLTGKWRALFQDLETRVYFVIIGAVTVLILGFGIFHEDFSDWGSGFRFALFQVVSVMTTTGYGTHDFNQWNNFGRGVLVLLMFVGGCAGSTGGGMKVIRHILFVKILALETELSYRPRVIRHIRLGKQTIQDTELRKNILVFFGMIGAIFFASWLFLITFESDRPWGSESQGTANVVDEKLLDCATAVAATLHNIGPGLGVVGPTSNYCDFSWYSKLLFVFLMMLGRLEIFSVLVLLSPAFWRNQA